MNRLQVATAGATLLRRLPGGDRPADRVIQRAQARAILATGLFDRPWYEVQSGRRFGSDLAAATDYLRRGRRAGLSPHPLFEPCWYDPENWRTRATDPLLYYQSRLRRHPSKVTHPLFAPARYLADHPASLHHANGPLGHFLQSANPQTRVDLGHLFGRPVTATWGEIRAHLEDAVRQLQEEGAPPPAPARDVVGPGGSTGPGERAISPGEAPPGAGPLGDAPAGPLVSVVLPLQANLGRPADVLAAVLAQRSIELELLVVAAGPTNDSVLLAEGLAHFDQRVRMLHLDEPDVEVARGAGIRAARGRYVAFADPGTTWSPDYLRAMVDRMEARGLAAARASLVPDRPGGRAMPETPGDRAELLAAGELDLAAVVLSTELVRTVGVTAPELGSAAAHEFLLRVSTHVPIPRLEVLAGVRSGRGGGGTARVTATGDQPVCPADAARARHLLDWTAALRTAEAPGRTAVVIPVADGARAGLDCYAAALAAADAAGLDVEVILVEHGGRRSERVCLAALTLADDRVRVVRTPPGVGRPLAFNLGIAATRAEFVVACAPDVRLDRGSLGALVEALHDRETGCVQPLVVGPDGSVASAGTSFTAGRARPVALFPEHPVEAVEALGPVVRIPALLGEVWAARRSDLCAVGGLDCGFAGAWAETDLSLRLAAAGHGTCHLVPPARATTASAAGTGWAHVPPGQRLADGRRFAARWEAVLPRQGEDVWSLAGLRLHHHKLERGESGPQLRAIVTRPARRVAAGPAQGLPSLRWSIILGRTGPADSSPDRRFADHLAAALRELGQEVIVDGRESRRRPVSHLDDVSLVLRRAEPVDVDTAATALLWVIGAPGEVSGDELHDFSQVLSTSPRWAGNAQTLYGTDVRTLLPGANPACYRGSDATTGSDADGAGPEVLYVGDLAGQLPTAVRYCLEIGADLHVYGSGWGDVLPAGVLRGARPTAAPLGGLYRTAGVVVVDHPEPDRVGGFVRADVLDVLACGGRLACDNVQGLELSPPAGPWTWETAPDLAGLLADRDRRFPDHAARAALAATVRREHSWTTRAAFLLDLVLGTPDGGADDPARGGDLLDSPDPAFG